MDSQSSKRAYRLIKLIQEIKCSPGRTIQQLLETLQISKAQFYKDKKALAGLGFEFSYDRSRARFVITRDAYLPVENLSISERLSLLMAVRQLSAAGDYILSFEGLNAARKLTADLPAPLRENALSLFDDLVLKKGFGCDRKIMEKLQTAITENRRIVLKYKRPDRSAVTEDDVDPYHIFFKRRALYLEGYSWTEKGIRMYRLNRIDGVSFTPMCFTVPADYDFGKRHRNAFSAFPGEKTQKVSIRFAAPIRQYIEESLWHHSQQVETHKNGDVVFTAYVAQPREVMWWAFQWGGEAEVLEPDWLREEACSQVEKMRQAYIR